MWRLSLSLVVLAGLAGGCGRVGYELLGIDGDGGVVQRDGRVPADAAGSDAAAIDAAGIDGGSPPPSVGPFGPGRRIDALASGYRDSDPTCTEDLLELYFTSARLDGTGNLDIWVSRRGSAADPWGAPAEVAELNTIDHEQTPEIAPDGLTLYLSSTRAGGPPRYDVYVSTRDSRDAPWTTPTPVDELDTDANDVAPTPSADGLRIMLHRYGPGSANIFEAARPSTGDVFRTPALVTELNSPSSDGAAFPWNDARTVVFDSNRPGTGSWDLYVATRPSLTAPFDPPTPISELNTVGKESAPWVSPDGGYILYTHSDLASDWDENIWEAFR